MTDEPIDQLKALEAHALTDQYSNHVLLTGLDQLRAHQRGEKVGKPVSQRKSNPRRAKPVADAPVRKRPINSTRVPRRVSKEMVAMVKASGPFLSQDNIAKQLGIAQSTVGKILKGDYG